MQGVPLYAHFADLAGVKPPFVLPVPAMNVINGGSHAGNALAFQEFMLLPTGAADFDEAMQMGTETYHTLKNVIKKKYGIDATNVGDEGGFAPNVQGAEESLEILTEAIAKAGYTGKVQIGLDVASSEFYKDGKYDLECVFLPLCLWLVLHLALFPLTVVPARSFKNPNSDSSKWLTGKQLAEFYNSLVDKYDIVSIEDPFDQDDWEAWSHLTQNTKIQVRRLRLSRRRRRGGRAGADLLPLRSFCALSACCTDRRRRPDCHQPYPHQDVRAGPPRRPPSSRA